MVKKVEIDVSEHFGTIEECRQAKNLLVDMFFDCAMAQEEAGTPLDCLHLGWWQMVYCILDDVESHFTKD